MRTLTLQSFKPRQKSLVQAGFTLLELLVVLVVISIATGLIVVRGTPGDSRYLENEAEKLNQILRIANQHALLKSIELRFSTGPKGYVFEQLENGRWIPVQKEPLLRERQWEAEAVSARLIDDGREVPFFLLSPTPGINKRQIVMQLNRTALVISSSTGGRFKMGQPFQQVEGQSVFGSGAS
ncbi:MAG: prepilin-type N-terminal cleavage/methylation domain-containing protein [Limnobacter sp.]|nr:prepilin-type N-terminal cleavage/methylation domain-containing protein [Limnobacter sp.]